MSSAICRRARSCLDWPTKAAIWLLSRPSIAYCERKNSLPTGVANVRLKRVPNRVQSVLQRLTSFTVGTLPICHQLSVDSFSISIYLLIFSAERLSVGKCMKKKIAPWLANCCTTYVIVKVYSQNNLPCILTRQPNEGIIYVSDLATAGCHAFL